MKINCKIQDLINGLNIVSKTTASKTTMPILEGVLLEAYENKLKLTTYDMEIGSEHIINSNIIEEGKTVVDLKMLNEIIRKLEGEEILLEASENIFSINSTNGVFKLSVMDAAEFPKLPVINVENFIEINQKVLKDMIRKILFAVSSDENRPVYTGALVKVEDNVLTVVAIDGFRLALKKYLSNTPINNFKSIIPGKVLSELLKIFTDSEDNLVKVGVSKNQAIFEMQNTVIISKIIEGEFLNYNSIIPETSNTKVRVRTKSILDSFERVALFAKENTDKDKKAPVKMSVSIEGITLTCVSQTGDAKETLTALVEGDNIEIGFNPRYVIEALKVVEDEEVEILFNSSISPAVIKPINGAAYMYVVLPIKLKTDN